MKLFPHGCLCFSLPLSFSSLAVFGFSVCCTSTSTPPFIHFPPTFHPFLLGFHRPLSGRWLIGSFCPAAFFGGFWWCWLCFCCRCCSAAFVAVWPAVKRNICIQFVYSFMAGKVPHSDFRDGTMNINTEINGKLKSFEPDFLSLSI